MPESGATSERLEVLKARWEADRGSRVFLQLADEYRRLGRIEEAARVLEEGLESTPKHTAAQVALGRCQLELGRTGDAVTTLEAALEGDPTQMVAYRLLVEAYLAQGKADEARERLRFYTLLNDADPEIAELRRRIGELDRGGRSAAAPVSAPEEAPEESPEEPVDETVDETAVEAPGDREAAEADEPAAAEPSRPEGAAPEPAEATDPFPDLSDTHYRRRFQEGAADGDLFAPEPEASAEAGGAAGSEPRGRSEPGGDPFELPPPPPPPSRDLAELLGAGAPGTEEGTATEARPEAAGEPTVTLGQLYLRQGHLEEAEGMFRAVLDRDPDNEDARRHLEELARAPAPALGAAELLEGYSAGERDGLTERKRHVLESYLDRLRGRSAHDVR